MEKQIEKLMELKDVCLKLDADFAISSLTMNIKEGEIFGFLGPSGAGKTTTIQELNHKGTTIFLTTHNMEEADKLCNRVGIIDRGHLIACGTPQELKLTYAKEEIEVMTAEKEIISVSKDAEGVRQILALMEAGNCLTIHSREPNLEEIFLHLTGREF